MTKTKRALIFVFLFLLVLVLPNLANAALNCSVTNETCNYANVFHMSNLSNAHAEQSNESDYNWSVCCYDDEGVATLGTGCTEYSYTILHLSNSTNAHVEQSNESDYVYNVCLNTTHDDISCVYASSCSGYDTCVASISNHKDAHIGDCVTDPYSILICCNLQSKGVISTTVGTQPFYTTSSNPQTYLNESCLQNMKKGNSCNVTWNVVPTGLIGSIWQFFTIFESTNYSSYVSQQHTSKGNITISGNTAPSISTPTINPDPAYTDNDLLCYANATDDFNTTLTIEYWWYNSSILFASGNYTGASNGSNTLVNTLDSSYTVKNETWNCTVRAYDGTDYSNYASATRTISNSLPEQVVLDYPEDNDTTFTNRTPRYNWTNATDLDGDSISYHIEVSKTENFSDETVNETSITNNYYDQPTELDFATYWWRVRANDSDGYGEFSDVWNFTLVTSPTITLVTDVVNFTNMEVGESNDTSDNNPIPFKIQNDGNIAANVSVNATALWTSSYAPLNTSYYQFKANYSDEANSFDYANSATTWQNMSDVNKDVVAILNHTDANDVVNIDIGVLVALDEPPNWKTSNVLFTAVET